MATGTTSKAPKKLGRPKADRDDVVVKFDRRLAVKARLIAGERGIPVAELLSGIARAQIERAYAELVKSVGE